MLAHSRPSLMGTMLLQRDVAGVSTWVEKGSMPTLSMVLHAKISEGPTWLEACQELGFSSLQDKDIHVRSFMGRSWWQDTL